MACDDRKPQFGSILSISSCYLFKCKIIKAFLGNLAFFPLFLILNQHMQQEKYHEICILMIEVKL